MIDVVEFSPLAFITDFGRWIQVENRMLARQKFRPLMPGRHETRSPDSISTRWFAITVQKHDEARKILILVPQAVVNPGTKTWSAAKDAAGVHLCHAAH